MFCRFGSVEDKPPRRRADQRKRCMHAPGFGVDLLRQRIGIGGFQFRHAAPFQNLGDDFMPCFRQRFQHIGRGRISAGLALAAARQTHFAEQHIAQLLRRADIERMPGEFVNFLFQRFAGAWRSRSLCCAQNFGIDAHADAFPSAPRRNQRPFDAFINARHMLLRDLRLEQMPEAQA